MDISANGLHLIEGFEGWSSAPYWDSYGGVWTRGYGETEGIGPRSPHISRAQGEANLKRLLEQRYEYAIRDLGVNFNQNQWDALCSFVWNLGAGIFTGSLRFALQHMEFRRAADEMLQYDHAGGQVLEGLRTRREAEARLFRSWATPAKRHPFLTSEEHWWLNRFDALNVHRSRHPVAWLKARKELVRLRGDIWAAAERGRLPNGKRTQKGWGLADRSARYRLLWSRTGN